MNATMSASCSIAPDSRRSDNCGRLLPVRDSTERFNCDKAMIGMFNSLAMDFNEREMEATSCSRLPRVSAVPVMS